MSQKISKQQTPPSFKLRLFSDYATSAELVSVFLQCFGNPPPHFALVVDNTFTHAIVINTPTSFGSTTKNNKGDAFVTLCRLPKENILGLAYEPHVNARPFLQISPEFAEFVRNHVSEYRLSHGASHFGGSPFYDSFAFLNHNPPEWLRPPLAQQTTDVQNKNRVSMMVSFKQYAPGHQYRHLLANEIIRQNLAVDIFGNGCQFLNIPDTTTYSVKHYRICGPFVRYEPYLGYMYHIAVENFITPFYFSEKIINCWVEGCVPVYLGCTNIDHIAESALIPIGEFPPKSPVVIKLTGTLNSDIEIIRDLCENVQQGMEQLIPMESRKALAGACNVWNHLPTTWSS